MATMDSSATGYYAVGFWLPCGHTNFFDSVHDSGLLEGDQACPQMLYKYSPKGKNKFQCSVFQRLCYILPNRGYETFCIDLIVNPVLVTFRNSTLNKERLLSVDHEGFYWLSGLFNSAEEAKEEAIGLWGDLNLPRGHHDSQHRVRAEIKNYAESGGVLTFFQLNAICEGLFNASFDTQVFFHHPEAHNGDARLKSIEASYALREFACHSVVCFHRSFMPHPSRSLIKIPDSYKNQIIKHFLHFTGTESLRKLKWRIEECRRALLPETIASTSTHYNVSQIEAPLEWEERIGDANASQLIGYVKFLTAKLPLLTNVDRYLEEVTTRLDAAQGENVVSPSASQVTKVDSIGSLWRSWSGLVTAIRENVEGLLRTIEHSLRERQLHEQEQIRYEQETVGEIERRRQRLGISGSEASGSSSGPLTALTILATIFTITYGVSQKLEIQQWSGSLLGLAIPTLIILFILDRRRKKRLRSNRFYYEMDIRLERPLLEDSALQMFDGRFRNLSEPEWWVPSSLPRVDYDQQATPGWTPPERRSYRFGQVAESEAIHKIHYETNILWDAWGLVYGKQGFNKWLPSFRSHRIMENCELTYEILYHRPSRARSFMLRELRFVTTSDRILNREELLRLKLLIVNSFINPWLQPEYRIGGEEDDELTPLFALTMARFD